MIGITTIPVADPQLLTLFSDLENQMSRNKSLSIHMPSEVTQVCGDKVRKSKSQLRYDLSMCNKGVKNILEMHSK